MNENQLSKALYCFQHLLQWYEEFGTVTIISTYANI